MLDCTVVGALCGTASGKAHSHRRRRVLLRSDGELLPLPLLKPYVFGSEPQS